MATGFILRNSSAVLLSLCAGITLAAEVALVGVVGDKAAVISIDGGAPKTVKVGQKFSGVTVIAVEGERATIEFEGKRRILLRGQHAASSGPAAGGRQSVTLAADTRGHFVTDGAINGGSMRFLVDTGASMIAIPARDALRLGIDYRKGRMGRVQTAAGPNTAWAVRFDTVRVGDIELNNVEGVVIEQGLEFALLGMSFLNRVEMRRDGHQMTLVRRF